MILVSKKLTANMAKLSELDREAIIQDARTSPNLLLNANLGEGITFWEECGDEIAGYERAITTIDSLMNFTNAFILAGTGEVDTGADIYGFKQLFYAEPGKYYTGSFYYRFLPPPIADKNKIRLKLGSEFTVVEQEDTQWHRASFTVVADHTILEFCVGLYGAIENTMVEFTGFQVEKGKYVSDWELSQQDLINAQKALRESVGLLEEAVEPQRIIDTVILSEEYTNAFQQKVNYDDISDFANRDEMVAEINRVEQYAQQVADDADARLSTLSSQLEQSATDILAKFKMSTGINLIRNSTGFFETDFWDKTGEFGTIANEELEHKGVGAAFYSTGAGKLVQTISVKPNTAYSFTYFLKKSATGKTTVNLFNGSTPIAEVGPVNSVIKPTFGEPFVYNFFTGADQNSLKIEIENSAGITAYFSGLMLNEGAVALQWSSHNEEIANTNIRFNLNGIYVKNQQTGSYTIMSPTEFSGYAKVMDSLGVETTERIFTLNGSTTEVYELDIGSKMTVGGMAHFVPLTSSGKQGLALFL